MALRTSPNIHPMEAGPASSPALPSLQHCTWRAGRRRSPANLQLVSCKQREKQRRRAAPAPAPATAAPSPLQKAEELAALFGLEMAVADLERLYHDLGGLRPPAFPDPDSHDRPRLRVAYQGVRGSYCQEAASAAFSPSSAAVTDGSDVSGRFSFLPCPHMEGAFVALEDGFADRAVIPIENSLDGTIHRNLDLLIRHPGVRIVGELLLPVDHCLLAFPGADRAALRRVVSHPQAIAHCRRRLDALGVEVEEVANAALAAEAVAEEAIRDTAVIGSKMAAREFGLRVLERKFQDQTPGTNVNRFLLLAMGGEPGTRGGDGPRAKTTVAFSLARGPSDLFRALWAFKARGVTVSWVDHRPNKANPVRVVGEATQMDYMFFLDLEAAQWDVRVQSGIKQLHEFVGFLRVLGSYGCTCCSQ